MEHHQSVSGQFAIPTMRSAIFEDIVFVLRVWIIEEVGITTLRESLHILHFHSLIVKCDRFQPTHICLFVSIIASWDCTDTSTVISIHNTLWTTIIATGTHQVISTRTNVIAATCIVEVGQTETVRELMTNGSDS